MLKVWLLSLPQLHYRTLRAIRDDEGVSQQQIKSVDWIRRLAIRACRFDFCEIQQYSSFARRFSRL
ncbi:hypothetical protein RMSM_04802 [Rhodopirellula maiorica SM1]|uniref:Uncharacterized protein n=1 Tax=Rhodopirellula maiorica SM1 TaxID=1265738 RepID=M5RWI4_9BACT|nr:hypothetical protein RMSM_04802 [Rhodopirellula maiorica SM1]